MTSERGPAGCTFTFAAGDFGGTRGFDFSVAGEALDAAGLVLASDVAPDTFGWWTYETAEAEAGSDDLPDAAAEPGPEPAAAAPEPDAAPVPRAAERVAVVVPAIGRGLATPARVVTGRRVKVSFAVTDATTGAAFRAATMSATPRVGGKPVRHVERLAGGRAAITLTMPKQARGKTLSVALTIRVGVQSVSRTVAFRIR